MKKMKAKFFFLRYGDFVPRRRASQMFAILWMIISVVMQSLLSGAIVAAITTVHYVDVKIYGTEVWNNLRVQSRRLSLKPDRNKLAIFHT